MQFISSAFLAAALILAGGAFAQDDSYPTGQPAAQPEKPQIYVREVSGDWEVRCLPQPEGKERCQIYQLVRQENGNPVAEVTIAPLPPGRPAVAGAVIVTPLRTLLTRQLALTIDEGETKIYPYAYCHRGGCVSEVGFTAPELGAMEKGSQIKMAIVSVENPKAPIELAISLTGFTAAYDALFD